MALEKFLNLSDSDQDLSLLPPCPPGYAVEGGSNENPQFLPPFPPRVNPITLSQIRFKEVLLIALALMLMICSMMLFFKHWKKNYRDINQLPYYAYLYQKDDPEFATPASVNTPAGHRSSAIDLWKSSGHATINSLQAFHHMRSMQNISPHSADSTDDIRRSLTHSHSGHLRLGTPLIPPPSARILARTGTAPTFFPKHSAKAALNRSSPATPPFNLAHHTPKLQARPLGMPFPPKRASSDVYTRFHRCRLEVMRRIQSGLELPEENIGANAAAAAAANDAACSESLKNKGGSENEEVCMVSITKNNGSKSNSALSLELEPDQKKAQSCDSSISTDV